MADIPATMKPWAGGDSAPADWDGGPVLLRNGSSYATDGESVDRLHMFDEEPHLDVVAYTPRATPDHIAGAGKLIPLGWRLVPVEPTEAMLQAAGQGPWINPRKAEEVWAAMLASSPVPEGVERLIRAALSPVVSSNAGQDTRLDRAVSAVLAALAASPVPERIQHGGGAVTDHPTPMSERERIARIIDNEGWEIERPDSEYAVRCRQDALAKADAIIAIRPSSEAAKGVQPSDRVDVERLREALEAITRVKVHGWENIWVGRDRCAGIARAALATLRPASAAVENGGGA